MSYLKFTFSCTSIFQMKISKYWMLIRVLTNVSLQNDTVTVRTRKFMTNRLLQRKQMVSVAKFVCLLTVVWIFNVTFDCSFVLYFYCFRLSMSCIQAKRQSPRPRSGKSLQRCTKPPQMWCSSSASKLSLVVAKQQALAWSTTHWTTPRKMSPNTGCKGYATDWIL